MVLTSAPSQEISAQITSCLTADAASRKVTPGEESKPTAISSISLQEKMDRMLVEDRTNVCEAMETSDQVSCVHGAKGLSVVGGEGRARRLSVK